MEVTRKVQINFIHRDNLGIAAATRTAFHTKTRPEGRFSQHGNGIFAYFVQTEGQTNAYSGFSDTCLCGADGSNQDKPG